MSRDRTPRTLGLIVLALLSSASSCLNGRCSW